jgi:NAD(P)-dependent dehydrogenase (short-subunit alcohol dehydrogenase family)
MAVTIDTILQRGINLGAANGHPLFNPHDDPSHRLLAGKVAIVTGANTGLGLETSRWLAAAGATVIMACRSADKAAAALSKVRADVADADVSTARLDLADLGSVRSFAASFSATGGEPRPLHMLVLNAGVMCVPQTDPETHFSVNHVAHALLALLLTPALVAGARHDAHARIVFVTSLTYLLSNLDLDDTTFAQRPYESFIAYANSKLCNLQFARALSARIRDAGVAVAAVHPGESTTDVARNLGGMWMRLHKSVGAAFLLSPEEASRTSVYAAAADEMADVTPDTVLHAVRKVKHVPERLVEREDVERLWRVTLAAAKVSDDELAAFCDSGGLRDAREHLSTTMKKLS